MSPRYLLVLLVLLTVQGVRAQTSSVKRGRSENPQGHRREIDHLVPVDPYYDRPELRKYAELKCKLLQIPASVEQGALMVYAPPFGPEECLFIRRPEKEGEPYAVFHTCADRSIWYSMPEHNDEGRTETTRGGVKVTRRETSLPAAVGLRVLDLWDRMLIAVRYPGPEFDGFGMEDATVIEFRYARRFGPLMYGMAHSPSQGAPKLLVDLGRSLIDYASADEAGRPGLRKAIEERCQALEDYFTSRAKATKPEPKNR